MSAQTSPTSSPFGNMEDICIELFGSSTGISNKEDVILKKLLVKYNQIVQNNLKPYADSLPYALNSVTGDLTNCVNQLVIAHWHKSKTHWDDYKAALEFYKLSWDSVVTLLKATPTARTEPVAVFGDLGNDNTLLQNIYGLTDSNGNVLPGF